MRKVAKTWIWEYHILFGNEIDHNLVAKSSSRPKDGTSERPLWF